MRWVISRPMGASRDHNRQPGVDHQPLTNGFSVLMLRRQATLACRLAFEIEFNQNGRLIALYPAIVSGLDHDHLRRGKFANTAVGEFHVDASARQEADMGVHAEVGADDGLYVFRPPESDRIDCALDASVAGTNRVELNAANYAVIGTFDGSKKGVCGH
jgi:hypothetical protein